MSVNDTDSAKCCGLSRSSANDIFSETLTGKFSGVVTSTVNDIVSNSGVSVSLLEEILSISDMDSNSEIVGTTETLSVRDRDSADSVMSELLVILSSSNIVSDNEMSASLIPETLSISDMDSDKLIVGLAIVLSVNATESDM